MKFDLKTNIALKAETGENKPSGKRKGFSTWIIILTIAITLAISVTLVVKLSLDYEFTNKPKVENQKPPN